MVERERELCRGLPGARGAGTHVWECGWECVWGMSRELVPVQQTRKQTEPLMDMLSPSFRSHQRLWTRLAYQSPGLPQMAFHI